jgi:hypothetical protein
MPSVQEAEEAAFAAEHKQPAAEEESDEYVDPAPETKDEL